MLLTDNINNIFLFDSSPEFWNVQNVPLLYFESHQLRIMFPGDRDNLEDGTCQDTTVIEVYNYNMDLPHVNCCNNTRVDLHSDFVLFFTSDCVYCSGANSRKSHIEVNNLSNYFIILC